MALNYISLVLDLADGTGTPLATGQALLNPSAQLTDATDDMILRSTCMTERVRLTERPDLRASACDLPDTTRSTERRLLARFSLDRQARSVIGVGLICAQPPCGRARDAIQDRS
jgi:hypothetical protein